MFPAKVRVHLFSKHSATQQSFRYSTRLPLFNKASPGPWTHPRVVKKSTRPKAAQASEASSVMSRGGWGKHTQIREHVILQKGNKAKVRRKRKRSGQRDSKKHKAHTHHDAQPRKQENKNKQQASQEHRDNTLQQMKRTSEDTE